MTYSEALEFIHGRHILGTKLGLEGITELLRRLDNPHKKQRFIHIAGTNGKGSTAAFIANVLTANGFKTGLFISPYINSFTERMQIDGVCIPENDLAAIAAEVNNVIDDSISPTEFEVVTAIGMLYFLHEKCDYVVLEVGLGGRFDATNVIPPPEVAVITSIALDHTALLGNTVEEIAFEKCGIIKPGSPAAVYPCNPSGAVALIEKTAAERGTAVVIPDKREIKIISTDIYDTVFEYRGERYEIVMPGAHQVYNAVTAITALELLGLDIDVKRGLKNTRFGGRMEFVSEKPTVIIDGAHNQDGAAALKNAIKLYFGGRRVIVIMGMLKDKDYNKAVSEIAPLADLFIAAEPDGPRFLEASVLENAAMQYTAKTVSKGDRFEALEYARASAAEDDVIVICGSLYLLEGFGGAVHN